MKSFSALIKLEVFVLLIIGLVMFLFTLNGCTARKPSDENRAVVAKIISRHVGGGLVKKNPDIASMIEKICQDIISQENPELISSVIKTLSDNQIDDPLLKADIQDIISLLNVKTEKNQIAQVVAEGLLSGILQGWSQL